MQVLGDDGAPVLLWVQIVPVTNASDEVRGQLTRVPHDLESLNKVFPRQDIPTVICNHDLGLEQCYGKKKYMQQTHKKQQSMDVYPLSSIILADDGRDTYIQTRTHAQRYLCRP